MHWQGSCAHGFIAYSSNVLEVASNILQFLLETVMNNGDTYACLSIIRIFCSPRLISIVLYMPKVTALCVTSKPSGVPIIACGQTDGKVN